mmetsp:Transcript_42534/g.121671  ORF Transcript_42534/g.121671 Transcript_42534/m.121671 type:complete len:299 (-) Transcript_42534:61-957(-)
MLTCSASSEYSKMGLPFGASLGTGAAHSSRWQGGASACHCAFRTEARHVAEARCSGEAAPPVPPAVSSMMLSIPDPRQGAWRSALAVACFCSFDPEQVWEKVLGHSILGNFFELGTGALQVEAPCERGRPKTFRNAEAAFHALQFWPLAASFSRLAGAGALQKAHRLTSHADGTFSGCGSAWRAMLAVLEAKFALEVPAAALVGTGDAFILAHDPTSRPDDYWANGGHGEGGNQLGLLLMLVRDRLCGRQAWTSYVTDLFDLHRAEGATPRNAVNAEAWKSLVRAATAAATAAVAERG